ncbi:MAG: carbohydrate porin [Verrucomicrobia bacterium]|nr:carbohydrate porin [Verrucomicrobiota bacterium]
MENASVWQWHGQNTVIGQGYTAFSAPYSGANSLPAGGSIRETISLDAIFGVRLWRGAEAHVDGMMWQGHGIGGTLGVAGFPNGEAFKLGTTLPNVNLARAFVRQTIGLGGETESVADGDFQLPGTRDTSRLTFTVGKFSAKDIFDANTYANDPRTQFLNWSLMANGAWDFPADALGYIPGAAAEFNSGDWAVRYGFFAVPRVANGTAVEFSFTRAWSMVAELEHRHKIGERAGAARLLAFDTRARMGSYEEAVSLPGADLEATRAYRHKFGVGLNLEQEVTRDLGAFLRAGWNDGRTETWMFTEIDRTLTFGLSLKGAAWQRPDDTVGAAFVLNDISRAHQRFLTAGGTGIIIGDGALRAAAEQVLECYYDCRLASWLHGALDYQFVNHPAYNRDRGPVSVFSVRVRANF